MDREKGGLEGRFACFYTWYFRKSSQYFRKFSWYFCFFLSVLLFFLPMSGQEQGEEQPVRNAAAVCPEVQMRAGRVMRLEVFQMVENSLKQRYVTDYAKTNA